MIRKFKAEELNLSFLYIQEEAHQKLFLNWLNTVDLHDLSNSIDSAKELGMENNILYPSIIQYVIHKLSLYGHRDQGITIRYYSKEEGASYGVTYKSRDERVLKIKSKELGRIDWLLENHFEKAYGFVEEGRHWDPAFDEDILPEGSGPYRSGLIALGEEKNESGYLVTGNPDGKPEAWDQEESFADWLNHCCSILEDRTILLPDFGRVNSYDMSKGESKLKFAKQREEFFAVSKELEKLLSERLFRGSEPKFYKGGHAAWDKYNEDCLSRDHVCSVIWDNNVIIFQRIFDRYYG